VQTEPISNFLDFTKNARWRGVHTVPTFLPNGAKDAVGKGCCESSQISQITGLRVKALDAGSDTPFLGIGGRQKNIARYLVQL